MSKTSPPLRPLLLAPLAGFSAFSFGEGAVRPGVMAKALAAARQPVLPLTDTLGFHALVEGRKAAEACGLRLLAGIHVPVEGGGDLFAYPDDEAGYTSLCRAISRHHLAQPFAERPPADFRLPLAATADLLGHLTGQGRLIACGTPALQALAGRGTEAWRPFWGITGIANRRDLEAETALAGRFAARAVALVLQRLARPGDALLLRILRAIHGNLLVDAISDGSPSRAGTEGGNGTTPFPVLAGSGHRSSSSSAGAGIGPQAGGPLPPDRLAEGFSWWPEAVEEAWRFAATPTWTPPLGRFHMPQVFSDPRESQQRLRVLAEAGARSRYGGELPPAVRSRLEEEFQVICHHGFTDYFLLVHEIVTETERQGHRVLGRGSAANSLISYALRMTHVDPLAYGLYFERFLNPGRTSPPDIDLDFSWRIRDGIFEFLRRRWGNDQVALICTHVTLGGRGAAREVGKALGFPADEINRFTRPMSWLPLATFLQEAKTRPECRNLPLDQPAYRRWLTLAARLEGLPMHLSLHAGGVVVAPGCIHRFTPVQPSSKAIPMTQMEMHAIEAVGLVKIDLLAQRSLGVFADVVRDLRAADTVPPFLDEIETLGADPRVAEALREGRTMGVFYIESPGMRSLLKKLHCRGFLELTAASSVIRPGVAESGMMQAYIARHRDPAKIPPSHPLLREVLTETHGVMIYQEDVMRVAHAMGGFNLSEADLLRRAMSGKARGSDVMAASHQRFIEGAAARGVDGPTAAEVWRQMESFSGYAFCKAHSASYAVLSLQLLWMKQYHPARFMAAVVDNRGGFYGTQAYLSEACRLGVTVLPPDVFDGDWDCRAVGMTIRVGMSFIKGMSRETADRIVRERGLRPFDDLGDFLQRVRPAADEWENLLDAGAMSRFGPPAACRWQRLARDQRSLFPVNLAEVPPFARRPLSPIEKTRLELKAMELAVSAHPSALFLLPADLVKAKDMARHINRRVRMGGLLVTAKSVTTKKGERMKFLTLEDETGAYEVTLFPGTWKRVGQVLGQGGVFWVVGKVDDDWGVVSLIAIDLKAAAPVKIP